MDALNLLKDCKEIALFGTGTGCLSVISILETLKLKNKVTKIYDRKTEKHEFQSFEVLDESKVVNLGTDAVLVIGSQYYQAIYERLLSYGKIKCKCLILNCYCGHNTYEEDEPVIPYTDERYIKLKTLLHDNRSREILENVIKYREIDYQFVEIGNDYSENWGGDEDYWKSVKAHRLNKNAVIVDGGAYIGDTLNAVINAVGHGVCEYHAFEPDEKSFAILQKNTSLIEGVTFKPYCAGLWSKTGMLNFAADAEFADHSTFAKEGEGNSIEVIALDDIEFPDDADIFIKMDIEGSEREALFGAEKLIRERKPSLAICVYHKANDIVDIPLYLHKLVPEYKFHLTGYAHTICIAQV